jgi:hypothetical protein
MSINRFHIWIQNRKLSNDGLQLRRAISIQAEATRLLEKYAIAPLAARLCGPQRHNASLGN